MNIFPSTVDKPAVAHKENFNTLLKAAKNGDLALLECQWKATGEKVAVAVAMQRQGTDFTFVPFAMFFNGNPYDLLNPPNPDGGFDTN